ALAVVLVQNVVDETAEQITGSNARITAAQVAAAEISDDTRESIAGDSGKRGEYNSDGNAKCKRLEITYGSALTEEKKKVVWADLGSGTDTTNGCSIADV
ncbi:MAG: hypothetical protein OXG52_05165, partial [bacterium]|nr:hypothetical protein [bacterium]